MRYARSAHLWRGFVVLLLAGMAMLVIRSLLVPETFGQIGRYRGAALAEIADQEPLFQGREMCNECHEDEVDAILKDTHHSLNCEDCHGPAQLHVRFQYGEEGDEWITEEMALLPKIKDRSLCLLCHRRLRARPVSHPQIDPDDHVAFLLKGGAPVDCVECHSPHEPIFLQTEASSARLHPVIRECYHCHDPVPETPLEEVEDHPPVFQCVDCHTELVKDFEARPHSFVSCAICHQYTQVSDTADRIYKNGNVKFCLLCHEDKSFKNGQAIPLVRWPAHLDEEKVEGADREKTCIQCHWEGIHTMSWGTAIEETGK